MLEAARVNEVNRFLFTSFACVYPGYRKDTPDVTPLTEEHAYPADAEDGYGWGKLFAERLCRHYSVDYGLETRVVRFHNIFGPLGTFDGGREKSPAAFCLKIAMAADKSIKKEYDTSKPQGVRGRNSDNSRPRSVLGWVPQIIVERGIEITYRWIREQLEARGDAAA